MATILDNIHKKKNVDRNGDFRNRHRTEWQEFLWDRFLEKIANTKSKSQTRKIINTVFSDYERKIVTKRLAALALIKEGKGSREIGRTLWLSSATISAIKKNFFNKSGIYYSQRSYKTTTKPNSRAVPLEKSWIEDFFGDIDLWYLITHPPRPRGTGILDAWDVKEYRRKHS